MTKPLKLIRTRPPILLAIVVPLLGAGLFAQNRVPNPLLTLDASGVLGTYSASGRIDVQSLIDRVISVDEAPSAYRALADGTGDLPLGVLIRYPDDARDLPEPANATKSVNTNAYTHCRVLLV